MNRVVAKNGARHNAEKLFDDLQDYTKNAILSAMACYNEQRAVLFQDDIINTYSLKYDLGAFYTDAYALSGIIKL